MRESISDQGSTPLDAEYSALHHRAVVVDRSDRGRMRFSGPKAAEVLNGLLTSDVGSLQPGQGQYSVALTAKGRVLTDARVFAFADSFLVDVPPRAWTGWCAMVKKFVNPRLAAYRDESTVLRSIGVFGPEASHIIATATGLSSSMLGTLPPYGHVPLAFDHDALTIVSVRELECPPRPGAATPMVGGFEVLVPSGLFQHWCSRMADHGAAPVSTAVWDIARVEAGRPEWGLDMDETTIAQEANLDSLGAMSFTKGCYTGQEVVARIHFRGHVNRSLRGLSFIGLRAPDAGAELVDEGGAVVGDVRSVVSSPRLGIIGLGMIRREVQDGASIRARSGNLELPATVRALPFDCA